MKQVCSLCSHRCHISKVQCEAGREYFGLKNNRGPMFIHNNDLNSKLMKCGRMLMHKTGRKRSQEKILEIINEHGSLSQRDLQNLLSVQAGSLSEILSKLERKGLLKKYRAKDDKRKLILQLTLNGKEYLKTYTKEKDMLDILTKEEKEQLNSILNKIIENIKKEH